jgi:putative tricarboxylic transport membrane protein
MSVACALAASVISASVLAGGACAQAYPDRPVTMLVAFPPGGADDAIARIIHDPMQEALGAPIVIENLGGAGGMIAAAKAAHAEPDGYTILLHQNALAAGMTLYPNRTFDAEKDFVAIGLVNIAAATLAGRPTLPPNNFDELVGWMKQPGQSIKVGHPGVGSFGHLADVLLMQELGINVVQVPYRGAGPALVDLLSGQVDLSQISAVVAGPLVNTGQLKAYAILGRKRFAGYGRARLQEARYRFLAHAAGARRHAAPDRRQAQQRAARCPRRCQCEQDLCRGRHGSLPAG